METKFIKLFQAKAKFNIGKKKGLDTKLLNICVMTDI